MKSPEPTICDNCKEIFWSEGGRGNLCEKCAIEMLEVDQDEPLPKIALGKLLRNRLIFRSRGVPSEAELWYYWRDHLLEHIGSVSEGTQFVTFFVLRSNIHPCSGTPIPSLIAVCPLDITKEIYLIHYQQLRHLSEVNWKFKAAYEIWKQQVEEAKLELERNIDIS